MGTSSLRNRRLLHRVVFLHETLLKAKGEAEVATVVAAVAAAATNERVGRKSNVKPFRLLQWELHEMPRAVCLFPLSGGDTVLTAVLGL